MKRATSKRSRIAATGVLCAVLLVSVFALAACAGKVNPGIPSINVSSPTTVPEKDSYGVVTAASWASQYPNEYNSYLANSSNVPFNYTEEIKTFPDTTSVGLELLKGNFSAGSKKSDYLVTNPEIKILGKGYGYAKDYTEPAGHTYSLWTVQSSNRINANSKIACYACKTPQYHFEAAESDSSFFKEAFTEGEYTENISCANCHVNEDPTQLNILRENWKVAMGSDTNTVPMESQVCGQCHCDYSMSPTTGEPTSPYTGGLASMSPEAALKFYDDNNYADWTYESTGAKMISVRHAEFEFNYADGGNHMTALGYTCSDCHMGVAVDSKGNGYTNHTWSNPLENKTLIENNCSSCHKDLVSEMKAIETQIDGRTTVVGNRAVAFIQNFEAAIAAGSLSNSDLEQLRYAQRAACYYWNLAAAENSEGAHNPTLYTKVLDLADSWLDKGDAILGVSSVA